MAWTWGEHYTVSFRDYLSASRSDKLCPANNGKGAGIRGDEERQEGFIVLSSSEDVLLLEHPLRKVRPMVDQALSQMSLLFDPLYASAGRTSIPPDILLRTP